MKPQPYKAPIPVIYPRPRYVSQRGVFWSSLAAAYGAGLVALAIALDFPPLLLLAVSLATLFASGVAAWYCWTLHRSRKARRAINLAVQRPGMVQPLQRSLASLGAMVLEWAFLLFLAGLWAFRHLTRPR